MSQMQPSQKNRGRPLKRRQATTTKREEQAATKQQKLLKMKAKEERRKRATKSERRRCYFWRFEQLRVRCAVLCELSLRQSKIGD
jgi:hypothetical protein